MTRQMKKQLFIILLCVCFIAGSLLAAAFIIVHADHDCSGHDCSVCVQIHSAKSLLKQLGMLNSCTPFIFAGLSAVSYAFRFNIKNILTLTPVTLKVRMNN